MLRRCKSYVEVSKALINVDTVDTADDVNVRGSPAHKSRPGTKVVSSAIMDKLQKEKTCFQNKFKFITEDQFTKHVNITIK